MPYRIELLPEVEKSLAAMSAKHRRQQGRKIDSLSDDPRPANCRKLRGTKDPLYRLASGDYRILYQVHDDVLTVLVVRVGDRKDVYRRLPSHKP